MVGCEGAALDATFGAGALEAAAGPDAAGTAGSPVADGSQSARGTQTTLGFRNRLASNQAVGF